MTNEPDITVSMSGKEWLDIKKFEAEQRKKRKPLDAMTKYFIFAVCLVGFGALLIGGLLTDIGATESASIEFSPQKIIFGGFLVLCFGLAIGWAIHGVGFPIILVRR